MPTRNVVLTDHQSSLVEALVASGRYQNASEVLREGLRLIERRDSEDEQRLASLREAARIGIADIEAGAFRRFESEDALGKHLATLAAEIIDALKGRNLIDVLRVLHDGMELERHLPPTESG